MTTTTTTARERLNQIAAALKASFPERAEVVDAMLVALVAKQHCFFVSPPGCAKSAIIRAFTSCVTDGTYFERLLSRFSTEEDLFGARSLSAMKADEWRRNTAGSMVEADVVMLDEAFKANGSILNALLTALNERVYHNGSAGVARMPLHSAFAASNELPEDSSLGALYDRFLVRVRLDYVQEDASFDRLLDDDAGAFAPPCTVAIDEIRQAHAEAMAIDAPSVSDAIKSQIKALRAELSAQGIVVSDRRWKQSVAVLRAAAWLDGAKHVELDHLEVLKWTLWSGVDQIDAVSQAIGRIDTGLVGDCGKLVDEALRVWAGRPRDPREYMDAQSRIATSFEQARKAVKVRCANGITRRAKAKIDARLAELDAAHAQLRRDVADRFGLAV